MAGSKIQKRQLGPLNITDSDIVANASISTGKLQAAFLIGQIPQKADNASVVHNSGDENIGGVKTFSSIPNIPTTIPTSDYQVASKKYVDDTAGAITWATLPGRPSVFPPAAHTHDASDIVSGTLSAARIPALPASQITTGTFSTSRIPTLAISKITGLQTALDGKEPAFGKNTAFNKNFGSTSGTVSEGNHTHPASAIVSGTLDVARIPNLPASRITSGTLSASRIPALPYLPTNGGSVNGLVYITPDQVAASGANRIAFANNGGSASTGTYIGAWNHNGDTAYYLRCYEVSGIQAEFYLGGVKATEFYRTSTREIKKNIKSFMDDALAIINSVDVVSYRLKKGGGHKKIGFIAEDTHEYLSTPDHNVMDTGSSVGLLIKAVQELSSKVNELERRLSCHE